VVVALVAVFAVLPGAPAFADPPTFETLHFSFNGVAPVLTQVCGFTVMRHQERTVRIAVFTDQHGNVVKELDQYLTSGSLVANGITVQFNDAGPVHMTFNADGTYQFEQSGLTYNYHGTNFRFAGRLVDVVDADGNVISESFSGNDRGSLNDICAALTP
jgi:hypothetical protein